MGLLRRRGSRDRRIRGDLWFDGLSLWCGVCAGKAWVCSVRREPSEAEEPIRGLVRREWMCNVKSQWGDF